MQLSGAAREDGVTLSVADVFRHPVLSAQASSMSAISHSFPSEPAPFSLLDPPGRESLLHGIIIPHQLALEDKVVDAFPTSQFQADCVNTHQCSYFLLDFLGAVDSDRLLAACQAVSKKYPILRSCFFPSGRGIIQAVLADMPLELARFSSDEDPLAFAKVLCHQDSTAPLPFGVPPFSISLVSSPDDHHVLILRLSHAQYDGLSLPVLYQDLFAAYQGDALTAAPSFAVYMQYRLSRKTNEVYQFWRDHLRDATMTHLDYNAIGGVGNLPVNYAVEITKEIPLPKPPLGITVATLVKAAWSVVLARLTRQTDLVFGHVVNARSVPILGSETILGPCANVIPVRVTLQPAWTALDLLDHVQHQHVWTLPFETSDLQDIVEHSTNWPRSTKFGTIVQHQNIKSVSMLSLEKVICWPTAVAFPPVTRDFYVVSAPADDRLEVSISASRRMVDPVSAADLLSEVCELIHSFTRCPDRPLSFGYKD
ncbi:hypothetical protein CNMCM8980_007092 [Aspergillus fumigatiaffinis]|nr:hypothetical protein CNMCM8980_007092 [Aspergillus fumigatiaffinis]